MSLSVGIPREIEESGIGQGGSPDFLAGARGIAGSQDPKRGRKIWDKADAGQNRLFSHERYISFVKRGVQSSLEVASTIQRKVAQALDFRVFDFLKGSMSKIAHFFSQRSEQEIEKELFPDLHLNDPEIFKRFFPKTVKAEEKKLMMIVWPLHDPNGAFSFTWGDSYSENLQNVRKFVENYPVEFCQAAYLKDIRERQQKLAGRQVHYLVFGGHGTASRVRLGEFGRIRQEDVRTVNFPNLHPKARILFLSCSTGMPKGIAETFSKVFPQATILAPICDVTAGETHFYIDSEGEPSLLQVNSNCLMTKIFMNGQCSSIPLHKDLKAIQRQIELNQRMIRIFTSEYYGEDEKAYQLFSQLAEQGYPEAMRRLCVIEWMRGNLAAATHWGKLVNNKN